jgi:hypothetical protein
VLSGVPSPRPLTCISHLTTITPHGAWRTTRSATLPINARFSPLRPCVPKTMRDAPHFAANRTIASAGFPVMKCERGGFVPNSSLIKSANFVRAASCASFWSRFKSMYQCAETGSLTCKITNREESSPASMCAWCKAARDGSEKSTGTKMVSRVEDLDFITPTILIPPSKPARVRLAKAPPKLCKSEE